MVGKTGLLAITLLGLSAFGGCETMYGRGQCPGGCCGGSCATGSTYAAPQAPHRADMFPARPQAPTAVAVAQSK